MKKKKKRKKVKFRKKKERFKKNQMLGFFFCQGFPMLTVCVLNGTLKRTQR